MAPFKFWKQSTARESIRNWLHGENVALGQFAFEAEREDNRLLNVKGGFASGLGNRGREGVMVLGGLGL